MKPKEPRRFLGMPYDWSAPTWQRIRARVWNPNDHRVLTPKVFGWGYSINFYELCRRLGLIRRR